MNGQLDGEGGLYLHDYKLSPEKTSDVTQEQQIEPVKSQKKKKARKPQTEEEYAVQKNMFRERGPTLNTEYWLYDEDGLKNLDSEQKQDRLQMLHACEKAYFNRDYERCLKLIRIGEQVFGVEDAGIEDSIDAESTFDASGKKTRKSAKLERHVLDLQHIKRKCVEKLESSP